MSSFLRKTKTKLRRIFSTSLARELGVDNPQLKVASIIRAALRDPDVELALQPVRDVRIMQLPEKHLVIVLEKNIATITNSKYSYRIEISQKLYEKLVKHYDKSLDERVEKMESTRLHQMETGLSDVLKSLS